MAENQYSGEMPGDNQKFIKVFSTATSIIVLGILFIVYKDSHITNGLWIDSQDYVVGRDFVNFWQYGVAAWGDNADQYYDPYWYNEHLDKLTPDVDYPDQLWSYPPHFMLLMAPFGLLSFNLAIACFTLMGIFAYWKIVVSPFKNSSASRALLTVPFFAFCLISGQLSFFLAALFVWLYRNIDAKPNLSGVFIALMTVKPHLGILIPLYLILTGRWQVFLVAAIGTILFLSASLFVHGVDIWHVYFDLGLKYQAQIFQGTTTLVDGLMPTALMNMVVANIGGNAAICVHSIFAIGALTWFCLIVWRCNDHFIQFATLITATFIILPYIMAYDFLILTWVLIMMAYRQPFSQINLITYRLVILLPILSIVLANFSLPGSSLITVLLGIWIWKAANIYKLQPAQT